MMSALPQDLHKPDGAVLTVWVIYERPRDYPEGYVLRPQWVMDKQGDVAPRIKTAKVAWLAKTADELRAMVPPGLVQMGRLPGDDPTIVEVWI